MVITAEDNDTVAFRVINKPEDATENQIGNVLHFTWHVTSTEKVGFEKKEIYFHDKKQINGFLLRKTIAFYKSLSTLESGHSCHSRLYEVYKVSKPLSSVH